MLERLITLDVLVGVCSCPINNADIAISLSSNHFLLFLPLGPVGYSFDIEYKSTKIFDNVDGLSRLPVGPDQA